MPILFYKYTLNGIHLALCLPKIMFYFNNFVGQNLLHTLPDSFGNLKSLRICMLSKNHLMWLPSNIGDLQALEDLRLDDNEVYSIYLLGMFMINC